ASMAAHLRRIENGNQSHVGLPIFPLRNFTARDLYVRRDGPVKTPADLIGKRIGMYDWLASGAIWYRHFSTLSEFRGAKSNGGSAMSRAVGERGMPASCRRGCMPCRRDDTWSRCCSPAISR